MKSLLVSLLLMGSFAVPTASNGAALPSLQDILTLAGQGSSIQSQSHSRIRTTIKGPNGKSVPVELSLRLQSQGTGDALLTLNKEGAPGNLVLALPESTLAPDDLADFVVLEEAGTTAEMHFTTIGALRDENEPHSHSLRHGSISEDTPAILLKSGESGELEVRLRLRDRKRLGRIFVTLGGSNSWMSVLAETDGLPYELGVGPSRLANARTSG